MQTAEHKRLIQQLKCEYDMLRVGQQIQVEAHKTGKGYIASARVVGVGRKWIHLWGGVKVEPKDIIDWWMG